jgi:hypothetical protein
VPFVGFFIQKTLQKLHRDEYFGGKRNSLSRSFGKASGTLWTDTIGELHFEIWLSTGF